MLYFVIKGEKSISWHVGEKKPHLDVHKIVEIQADCDELEYIYSAFKNIPSVRGNRVVSWFGEIAKFIAHNL